MADSAFSVVIWFTGLSAAGKSTIASLLSAELRSLGHKTEELDGDLIRNVFPATGFSKTERDLHVRRVGFLASRLESHGITVVASLISPYEESRNFVRSLCKDFIEVYVSTPLNVCEQRDPKGLYKKARSGALTSFTGLDDPYEVPKLPEVKINTENLTPKEAVDLILKYLANRP